MVSVGRTAAGSTTCQTELDWGGDRCPPVTGGYRVVVPLPSWTDALPHLAAPPGVRRTLAGAFARDTLDAVRKVGRVHDVLVATADPLVAEEASAWGAGILDCSGIQASCIREAAREAFLRAGLQGATAVLEGTLPCLLPAELDQAIRTARREPVEVLDLAGIRPTLRADPGGWPADVAHPEGGTPLRAAWLAAQELLPGLSCDVATLDGLRVAAFVGVGPATAHALLELGDLGIRPRKETRHPTNFPSGDQSLSGPELAERA